MAKLVGDVAPFDITKVAHPAHELLAEWIVVRGSRPDVPDTRRLARLLRVRREWPRRCRAAEQRDELAASCVEHVLPSRSPLCQLTAGSGCLGSARRSLG